MYFFSTAVSDILSNIMDEVRDQIFGYRIIIAAHNNMCNPVNALFLPHHPKGRCNIFQTPLSWFPNTFSHCLSMITRQLSCNPFSVPSLHLPSLPPTSHCLSMITTLLSCNPFSASSLLTTPLLCFCCCNFFALLYKTSRQT